MSCPSRSMARYRALVHKSNQEQARRLLTYFLLHTLGTRHAELDHPIEDGAGEAGLDLLRLEFASP